MAVPAGKLESVLGVTNVKVGFAGTITLLLSTPFSWRRRCEARLDPGGADRRPR